MPYRPTPWHFLYFLPEPQGQGSLRPTSGTAAVARPTGPTELLIPGLTGGGAGTLRLEENKSSVPEDSTGVGSGGGARRARGSGGGGSALTWILKKRSVKVDWMSCIRSSNISKASRLYSTSGSFWPQARYWIALRSWSRSYRWSFHRSSS